MRFNIAKNTVNYSSFARLSFVITVTSFILSREIAWAKPLGLCRARGSAWEVLLKSKMGIYFHYFEDANAGWIWLQFFG